MAKNKFFASIAIVAIISLCGLLFFTNRSEAVTANDWRAGNIVDDFVFTNSNDMTVADIQTFLNNINPNCDTYGTGRATERGRGDITRAQYAASRGWAGPPYVCLKDYYEVPKYTPGDYIPANNFSGSIPSGAVSAAQIIYDAAKRNNLSPKVILVKIATESAGPLTTDNWPLQSQYTYAMGSHCPDSGPGGSASCDRNYAGFSMQVESGAQLMRWYIDNMEKPWWTYKKPFATNSILWNVVQKGCGAGNVYISSKATAALYTYTPYQPNQAALNNMYGLGDRCSSYGNRNFWRVWSDWFGSTQYSTPLISFKSHISYYGWTGLVHNKGITGFTGQSKSMQAFSIDGDVTYSSYSEERGWQPTVYGGMQSGTTELNRPIQAIKIQPTGSLASKYDIYYRVHVSYVGWMGWAKNGMPAGSTGISRYIEAIQIRVSPKNSLVLPGGAFYNPGNTPIPDIYELNYATHVSYVGWTKDVGQNSISGTTGRSLSVEAIRISKSIYQSDGSTIKLYCSSKSSNDPWSTTTPMTSDKQICGTTGQTKPLNGIKLSLDENDSSVYDVYYQVHLSWIGWQEWKKNGEIAGDKPGSHIEAIRIKLVEK